MNKILKMMTSIMAIAAVFVFSVAVVQATSHGAVKVVTGDTATAENNPGWMFNRDTTTMTPYEFNTDQAKIGEGSLYVMPIGSNPSDKFIGEYFLMGDMGEVESISYDFMIGADDDAADADHFYMNVYANFAESADTKFYDCRYNVVPTTGTPGSWSTATFNPTSTYAFTQSGSSPATCPSSPADMGADATIRMFAINVGDTSANDEGLDGYYDNVEVNLTGGTTIFDFEPRHAKITSPESGENVPAGDVLFEAYLVDNDVDNILWAVRQGACTGGTTVFGNVDGHTDSATINTSDPSMQTFSYTGDMSSMTAGSYCFIYNPQEDSGEAGVRETVTFNLVDGPTPTMSPMNTPSNKDQCKNGGWMNLVDENGNTFRNQGQCVSWTNQNL